MRSLQSTEQVIGTQGHACSKISPQSLYCCCSFLRDMGILMLIVPETFPTHFTKVTVPELGY